MSSIVTFYSYKGGVGRSMALANVAVLLARRGLRVLALDWDLEAPGIENYFSYFSVETERGGLLNLFMDVSNGKNVDYRDYVSAVRDKDVKLSLITSGRATDSKYSANLERFDWRAFFAKGGGEFLEDVRERWKNDFDLTLIDSRTGLSDSGGICTIQLPDIVVAMFTANHQSLYGVRDVMQLAQTARHSLAHDRPQMNIVPLASRFANDFRESKSWLDRTSEAMSEFYRDWLPSWANAREVAEHLKIPHVDYFGYGEKLAVVEQGTTDPQGMGFAYEKVANLLANDLAKAEEVFQLKAPPTVPTPPAKRKEARKQKSSPKEYRYDLYVSFQHNSLVDEWVRGFIDKLASYINTMVGRDIRIFLDYREIEQASSLSNQLVDALSQSALLLAIVTPRYFQTPWTVAEWMTFERREQRLGMKDFGLILPVAIMDPGKNAPDWFLRRQYFDMRESFGPGRNSIQQDKAIIELAERIVPLLEKVPPPADHPVVLPEDIESLLAKPPPPPAFQA